MYSFSALICRLYTSRSNLIPHTGFWDILANEGEGHFKVAFKYSPDEGISVDGNFTQIIGSGYLLILYQHKFSASAAAATHMKS